MAMPPAENLSITVLLVDDSAVVLHALRRVLAQVPQITVVGTATTGAEALVLIPLLQPQVVCLDFHMPLMHGLELTRQIMTQFLRPILAITTTTRRDSHPAFELLAAGAVDGLLSLCRPILMET